MTILGRTLLSKTEMCLRNVLNVSIENIYWPPNGRQKGPIKSHRVCLPFRLFGHFVAILLFFSKFWHGARNPYEVVCDRARFSRKKNFPNNSKKWTKNGPNTGFFDFIEKFVH